MGVEMTTTTAAADSPIGSVAVIGAGISGLAAAYRFRKEGVAVTVFEAESFGGGVVQTERKDGYMWERGPNTMMENSPIVGQVISDLKLEEKIRWPVDQSQRYTVRDGKPIMLPSNPIALIGSKLLSPRGKLRMLAEPFCWKPRRNKVAPRGDATSLITEGEEEESVGDFLERHVGQEPVDYLIDPFLAGTSGSAPQTASIKHEMPLLWEMEQKHGSLFVGALAAAFSHIGKKAASRIPRLKKGQSAAPDQQQQSSSSSSSLTGTMKGRTGISFSFVDGLQTLPDALIERVGRNRVRTGCKVLGLDGRLKKAKKKEEEEERWEWRVSYTSSANKNKKRHDTFDAVLVTAPLYRFRDFQISKSGKKIGLDSLPRVNYLPISVIVNAFKLDDVKRPLGGFGVLIPSKEEGFKTIGTIFSSAMFSERAPSGYAVFNTFIGGSRATELAHKSTEELQKVSLEDLRKLVGVEGKPVFSRHIYWPKAFPEYSVGYGSVLKAMEEIEKDLPGVYVAGNHRGGRAVGKVLQSGYEAAGRIVEDLKNSKSGKIFTIASSAISPSYTWQDIALC